MKRIGKQDHNYSEYLIVEPFENLTGKRTDNLIITFDDAAEYWTETDWRKYGHWYRRHARYTLPRWKKKE